MNQFALGVILGLWILTASLALLWITEAFGSSLASPGPVILLYGSVAFSIGCTITGMLLFAVWHALRLRRR